MDLDKIEVTNRAPNLRELCLHQRIVATKATPEIFDWLAIRDMILSRSSISPTQLDELSVSDTAALFERIKQGLDEAVKLMDMEKRMIEGKDA